MKLDSFKCVTDKVLLDDYYKLYNDVRNEMENPQFLGLIPKEETIKILENNGKIWLYYDNNIPVCSIFYHPSNKKTLQKHHIDILENEIGFLGPIMVKKDYVGNGLMYQMLEMFNEYNKKINNKYIFTKVCKDNIYSLKVLLKNGYEIVNEYENERGINLALIKKI